MEKIFIFHTETLFYNILEFKKKKKKKKNE